MADSPHFRIVYPESFRGKKHRAGAAQVFVTWPGQPEQKLPSVSEISAFLPADGAVEIVARFVGSVEIEYSGEDPEPLTIPPSWEDIARG